MDTSRVAELINEYQTTIESNKQTIATLKTDNVELNRKIKMLNALQKQVEVVESAAREIGIDLEPKPKRRVTRKKKTDTTTAPVIEQPVEDKTDDSESKPDSNEPEKINFNKFFG